jgi:hypothetical protein
MLRSLSSLGAPHQQLLDVAHTALLSRGDTRCRSTWMMAFANTEDPWIDYLIISRLEGYYATPIIQFFQDRRFGIKIDP